MKINCLHFNSVNSTSTWSKENYHSFDPQSITLVTADHQTAGRGQFSRSWLSPEGKNIYATFTFFIQDRQKRLKPNLPPMNGSIGKKLGLNNISQVVALSIVKTLKDLGLSPLLKWPNDVQIRGKKVGGILSEIFTDKNQLVVMIGVGINVNMPLEMLNQIDQPATSLMVEKGTEMPLLQVLQGLKNHLMKDLDVYLREGFSPFIEDYKSHLAHQKGDILTLKDQKGLFKEIDSDGALIVFLADGSEKKLYSI